MKKMFFEISSINNVCIFQVKENKMQLLSCIKLNVFLKLKLTFLDFAYTKSHRLANSYN